MSVILLSACVEDKLTMPAVVTKVELSNYKTIVSSNTVRTWKYKVTINSIERGVDATSTRQESFYTNKLFLPGDTINVYK